MLFDNFVARKKPMKMKLNAYNGGVDSFILVRYTHWARN